MLLAWCPKGHQAKKEMIYMYKIQPYIWQDIIEGQTIFQTKNSTVVITNKKLRDFLVKLESEQIIELDDSIFDLYFDEMEKVKVISFLLENGILREKIYKKMCIDQIVILSNDDNFSKSMLFNLNEIKVIRVDEIKTFKFKKDDLLIIFLNPFSLDLLKRITHFIKTKNLISKFIFSYNNRIYFSNFYRQSWYNPCPLCFFYALESQLRGENSENNINFQTIIDILYAQKAEFSINLPLDSSAYLQIVYVLSKYFNKLPDDRQLDEVLELNLKDYSISKDIAYHWGYCDCYE